MDTFRWLWCRQELMPLWRLWLSLQRWKWGYELYMCRNMSSGGSGAVEAFAGKRRLGWRRCEDTMDQHAPDEAQHISVSLCWPTLFMLILVSLTDRGLKSCFSFQTLLSPPAEPLFLIICGDSFLLYTLLSLEERKKQNQTVWRCCCIIQTFKNYLLLKLKQSWIHTTFISCISFFWIRGEQTCPFLL